MRQEALGSNTEIYPRTETGRVQLTPYQLSQLVLFPSISRKVNSKKIVPFGALGGATNEADKSALERFGQRVLDEGITGVVFKDGLAGLADLARSSQEEEALKALRKISSFAKMTIITAKDLSSPRAFDKLPLMAQLSLAQTGSGLFGQVRSFLEAGGIMKHLQFVKPAPNYLWAIDKYAQGDTTIEKITNALTSPDRNIGQASHQFNTVYFIPPVEGDFSVGQEGNPAHFAEIINQRLDNNVEENYAKMILLRTMLSQEMESAVLGMVGVVACLPLLHWINSKGENKLLAQAIIKFIPPFLADMVSFYAQLNPWLEGETFGDRAKDFVKKLSTTHRKSFITSLGATALGSALSEAVTNDFGDIPGALIYSSIPFAVAMQTSWDTMKSLQKKFKTSNWETIKTIFANNPAHLAVDIGAGSTVPVGVAILGFGGKIHDPTAIALIEGALEHTVAALLTKLQLAIGVSHRFRIGAETEIGKWRKKTAKF